MLQTNAVFPQTSAVRFVASCNEHPNLLETSPYGLPKPEVMRVGKEVAKHMRKALEGTEIMSVLQKGLPDLLIIDGLPMGAPYPAPREEDLQVPPQKDSFVEEWSVIALHILLGLEMVSRETMYGGDVPQNISVRRESVGKETSKGTGVLGWHTDSALDPMGSIALLCVNPDALVEGGDRTTFRYMLGAANRLPQEAKLLLSLPLFEFEQRGGGVFKGETYFSVHPIIKLGKEWDVVAATMQSRRGSVISQTPQAEWAYNLFRQEFDKEVSLNAPWIRGRLVIADNRTVAHTRSQIIQDLDRHLIKFYGDRIVK